MNPLLKVNPKKITRISNQREDSIAMYDVFDRIEEYIKNCAKDADNKTHNPKDQHLVPKFLLKDFEGTMDGYANKIKVVEYRFGPKNKPLSINTTRRNRDSFSTKKDFYTILELHEYYENQQDFGKNDKYRIEKLFSVIEGNANCLLEKRQEKSFYCSKTFSNPYWYPDDVISTKNTNIHSKGGLDDPTDRRIALAVFFAMQYLRSQRMHKNFSAGKMKIDYENNFAGKFKGENFLDFIWHMLPSVAYLFYSRTWRWVYSIYDGFMPAGTTILALFPERHKKGYALAQEDSLIMPLGRHSTIYFRELYSFKEEHDGVFNSKSLALATWNITKVLPSVNFDIDVISIKKRISEVNICMHPDTDLSPFFKVRDEQSSDASSLTKKMQRLLEANKSHERSAAFLGNIYRKEWMFRSFEKAQPITFWAYLTSNDLNDPKEYKRTGPCVCELRDNNQQSILRVVFKSCCKYKWFPRLRNEIIKQSVKEGRIVSFCTSYTGTIHIKNPTFMPEKYHRTNCACNICLGDNELDWFSVVNGTQHDSTTPRLHFR